MTEEAEGKPAKKPWMGTDGQLRLLDYRWRVVEGHGVERD